jgi:hypothetical protein
MRTLSIASVLVLALASSTAAAPTSLAFDPPARHATPRLVALAEPAADPAGAPLPAAPPVAEGAGHGTTIFGLPKNIGPVDRVARAVIGAALLGAGVWGLSTDGNLSTTTSAILTGVSAIPLATAATGYCPLYQVVGVDYTF